MTIVPILLTKNDLKVTLLTIFVYGQWLIGNLDCPKLILNQIILYSKSSCDVCQSPYLNVKRNIGWILNKTDFGIHSTIYISFNVFYNGNFFVEHLYCHSNNCFCYNSFPFCCFSAIDLNIKFQVTIQLIEIMSSSGNNCSFVFSKLPTRVFIYYPLQTFKLSNLSFI